VRLFVAVYPPPAALDELATIVDRLALSRAHARVTARELWHVTLAFIGELPDADAPAAVRALDRAAERLATVRPVVRLAGGGRFGRGKFTVVWAGLGGDVAGLGRIADEVRHELRAERIRYDTKHFAAHLTIARPGDRLPVDQLATDLDTLAGFRGSTWTPRGIALVESHLGPHPRHDTIHVAALS
jgi:2'-5' RNA ligase